MRPTTRDSRLCRRVVLFLAWTVAGNSFAAGPFEVWQRDGSRLADVRFREIEGDRVRLLAGGEPFELSRSSILGFRSTAETPRGSGGDSAVRLVNGDILAGELMSLDETGLLWRLVSPDRGADVHWEIPLEFVLGIAFGTSFEESLEILVPRASQTGSDRVRLGNGDELTGDFTVPAPDDWNLETATGTVPLPRQSVRKILFNEELTETPPSPPAWSVVTLESGTRLSLADFRLLSNSRFHGITLFGQSLELSMEQLHAAVWLDSTTRPLSTRPPDAVEYQPFLTSIPEYRVDAALGGGQLRIGRTDYSFGFSMHSRTRLTWTLSPEDEFLVAEIGLDPRAGERGNVQFRVLLDDDAVFESDHLTGRDAPRKIRVDLREAKTLSLIADYGQGADVLDLAVWGNPLVLGRR
jgi:hypothetical protein